MTGMHYTKTVTIEDWDLQQLGIFLPFPFHMSIVPQLTMSPPDIQSWQQKELNRAQIEALK